MRSKVTAWLLAVMLTSFVVANLLPAVALTFPSKSSAFYTPGQDPMILPGWACTYGHPVGWATVLVHFLGVLFFLVFWLRRKCLRRAFVIVPLTGFGLSLYVSVLLLLDSAKLLVGHHLWVFSLIMAIPFYWSLGTTREEPDQSLLTDS